MTALTDQRGRKTDTWRKRVFTLQVGTKAYKGGTACIDRATGKVVPGTASANLVRIGVFTETVDATSAALPVNVDLLTEITIEWLANDTVSPLAATDVGGLGYQLDDQTVTADPAGNSISGRVWAVDTNRGVAIEKTASGDKVLQNAAAISYTSNSATPTSITSGAMYDVPTTGAASTIVLPAAAPNGTYAYFAADGTKNGHTVQYVDATGSVNLTTALTASKRHLVLVVKRGGKWFANAYVGP